MANEILKIEKTDSNSITHLQPVLFDTVVTLEGDIAYNSATGTITISSTGRYIAIWTVSPQSTLGNNGVTFALEVQGGDSQPASTVLKSSQITGTAYVEVVNQPVTLTLNNTTGSVVYFDSPIPVKASLLILSVQGSTTLADSSQCFAMAQLTNVLRQILIYYPTNTLSVFTSVLTSYNAQAYALYTSPQADDAGIFVITNGTTYVALSIAHIVAVYVGSDAVYNDDITYLTAPDPLPAGCDTNVIAAFQSYATVGETVTILLGVNVTASGPIFRKEYGLLVIADEEGNTPIFIPTYQIAALVQTPPDLSGLQSTPAVHITTL